MTVATRSVTSRCFFDLLSNDLVAEILYRAPSYSHDVLTTVCQLFRQIIHSESFFVVRREYKLTEPVLLAFGGFDRSGRIDTYHEGTYHTYLSALVEGRRVYLSDPPVWGDDMYHAVLDNMLVLIGGGQPFDGFEIPETLAVHVYDAVTDEWLQARSNMQQHTRSGAVCAAVGDRVVIAGGDLRFWLGEAANESDPFGWQPTTSVLALTVKRSKKGEIEASWKAQADLPRTLKTSSPFRILNANATNEGSESSAFSSAFSLNNGVRDCFYVADRGSLLMNDMSEGLQTWTQKARLPEIDGGFAAGAVHGDRFFLIARHKDGGPTIYAYRAVHDTWELQPPLPWRNVPDLLHLRHSYGSIEALTMTSCAAGLLVLGCSSGKVAMLDVIEGVVTSARCLANEDWAEGHSRLAQEGRLAGLHAASFELTRECRPLLKAWADEVEEEQGWNDEQEEEEDRYEVEHLGGARLWLTHAGNKLLS